jgi:hypothetical protein
MDKQAIKMMRVIPATGCIGVGSLAAIAALNVLLNVMTGELRLCAEDTSGDKRITVDQLNAQFAGVLYCGNPAKACPEKLPPIKSIG